MKNLIALLFITLCFSTNVYSNTSEVCAPYLESLPTQQAGRDKPLYVHAKETIKYLTGKAKVNGENPVTTYCKLSLSSFYPEIKAPKILLPVLHVELQKLFGLKSGQKDLAPEKIAEYQDIIRSEYLQQKEESSYKKSLNEVAARVQVYNSIKTGTNWMIPLFHENKISWANFTQLLKVKKDFKPNQEYFKNLQKQYIEINSDNYLMELTYVKAHLAGYSLAACILSIIALVLLKNQFLSLGFAGIALILQTAILVMRVMISGRAPITNMYETVLFSGYGALLIALIIGHFKKDKIFILVGACYNICTLFMLIFANQMLDSAIQPLVPVLRDNFWLSTHVTCIILSYSGLALSWVLANIVLYKRRFGHINSKEERYYADITYTCMKVGTVLLAAGVILGGVWADYSWGRFWGWDPKETWSLIVLCIYMAIIHGKYTSWIPPKRFVLFTAAAFMSVMMAWFGVNYILASGLHSYGFSAGGAVFLGSFFALQIIFLVLTTDKLKRKKTKI
jgi:cytochrome c-type biogenesis protein CcsB